MWDGSVGDHTDSVHVAKMLTVVTIMFITVGVRVPLVKIIYVSMMRLMKDLVIYRLSDALHAGEKHSRNQQL